MFVREENRSYTEAELLSSPVINNLIITPSQGVWETSGLRRGKTDGGRERGTKKQKTENQRT